MQNMVQCRNLGRIKVSHVRNVLVNCIETTVENQQHYETSMERTVPLLIYDGLFIIQSSKRHIINRIKKKRQNVKCG